MYEIDCSIINTLCSLLITYYYLFPAVHIPTLLISSLVFMSDYYQVSQSYINNT